MIDYEKLDKLVEKLKFDPKEVKLKEIKHEKKEKPKYDYYRYHKRPQNHPDRRNKI